MYIYPSTKVKPYVYFGTNLITGEFYIGYREANIVPSHIDLFEYRTSSETVKPIFDNFNWFILAEFKSGNDAYDFEQQLIFENWENPLLLNKQYRLTNGKKRFKATSSTKKGKSYEELYGEEKARQIKSSQSMVRKNKPKTAQHKERIGRALKGISKKEPTHTTPHTEKAKEKMRGPRGPQSHEVIAAKIKRMTGKKRGPNKKKSKVYKNKGIKRKPHSDKHNENISAGNKGKTRGMGIKKGPQIIIICPYCSKEGGASMMKRYHFNNCKTLKK